MGIFTKLLATVSGASPEVLPENAILIDVRSPQEFASGHIQGAISLPLNSISHQIDKVVPNKGTPVIVYCMSGARSASARKHLLGMGYLQVFNGGGVRALSSRMKRKIRSAADTD